MDIINWINIEYQLIQTEILLLEAQYVTTNVREICMMRNDIFWKRFEKSGKVEDYLEYACTTEDSLEDAVIGDVIEDKPEIILPGYDDSIQIY